MLFFLTPASIAEAAAVIPNGTATFINVPASLLNNSIMILKTLQIELF